MATIYPVIVSSSEELDKAASENKAVILVVNKDLIPAIKQEVREDNKKEARFRKAWKTTADGAKTVAAGTVVAALAGTSFLGIPAMAAMIAAAAGTAVTGGGVIASLITASSLQATHPGLFSKLNYYLWNEIFEEKYLLLVKKEGRNKYDPKTDIISFDQVRGNS